MAGWVSAALLLLLGALVVVWGTEYKLSLYRADSTMQMPAKLCTRSSEAAKSQVYLATRPVKTETHPFDSLTIPRDTANDHVAVHRIVLDVPLPSSPEDLPQVAFRPPPALARIAT